MVDLHAHALPNIDDGAKNADMSLEMLKEAKRQGVNMLVATPHCMPENEAKVEEFVTKRRGSFESIRHLISDESLFPRLYLGAEVFLGTDISEYGNLRELCIEGTDYIMLEMDDNVPLNKITEWVYNVKIKGLKPIIAHVDRYSRCFDYIEELSPLGIVFQINAARFLTMSDRRKLKNIFSLYNKFCISSDMHNLTTRPCTMQKAREMADKKFSGISGCLFEKVGMDILHNK